MKKIFTLFAVAAMAMCAKAQSNDIVKLDLTVVDTEHSANPNWVFTNTNITLNMNRDIIDSKRCPTFFEDYKDAINFKCNGVGTLVLPEGVKLYRVQIGGFSQGDNWTFLAAYGSGEKEANGGKFEWVEPLFEANGTEVKDNKTIIEQCKYPIDPCGYYSSADVPSTSLGNKPGYIFADLDFTDEPYEGEFSVTFSGNNQLDVHFVLYLSLEAAKNTGIATVNADKLDAACYNLSGMKVSKVQGLYIQNGVKKFVK